MQQVPSNSKSRADDFDDIFKKLPSLELINPRLSRWDKEDLYGLLHEDLMEFVKRNNIAPYNTLNKTQFEEELEKVFPKYMVYDTYNINHTPTDAIEMGEVDENNKWLFDFLMNKATDYYSKTITQSNPYNSYVYASEIVQQLLLLYQQQNPDGPGDDGEDEDGNGQSGMEKMLSKMMGNKAGNQQLDQAMQKAQKQAQEKIDQAESQGESTGELGCDKELGDLTLGELSEFMDYQEALNHIKLNDRLIDDFVKTTLSLSSTYFSTKYTEFQLEMLEADVLDDLQGLENLHPKLRALNLDQVVTHDRKYHMKFDVYIDISGSMSSSIYSYTETATGKQKSYSIQGLDLAKITAIKLRNLGYVEDVYPFEGHVHDKLTDNHQIALMHTCGGTSIDSVIRNITKTGRPSVVVTDMEDSISIYDDNVYFVGILSAGFESFKNTTAGKKYIESRQCVKYNGDNGFEMVI